MPIYSLFALRNDNIQEFDTRWDEILLSMEQFPLDDILESLYKLRRRESENRLKTMEKRSIEQDLRSRHETLRLELEELSQIFWSRIRGNNVAFTKDKETVGDGKPVFERRPLHFLARSKISVQKLRHSLLLLQNIRRKHKV